VNEVHEIFAHAVQARWEALVFDSFENSVGMAFLPCDRIPWVSQYNVTLCYTAIGAFNSPHLLIEDYLEEGGYWRRFSSSLSHCARQSWVFIYGADWQEMPSTTAFATTLFAQISPDAIITLWVA
jgi:hypothetical protein